MPPDRKRSWPPVEVEAVTLAGLLRMWNRMDAAEARLVIRRALRPGSCRSCDASIVIGDRIHHRPGTTLCAACGDALVA